ncbi:MAG: transcriptional regulator GcvA [Gammaproteobacteria bacterium]|nr:transcriptional regulator GcvA [Gammaproteobacteria bacterium]
MRRDIPSLNAIRFFESAARHLSFTRAGEEQFVTQGAVSKQIKSLEEQLGCQLFARNGPNLRLTRHGEKFNQTVSDALDIISQGVGNLRRDTNSTLTISVLPSFSSNWLVSRLPMFEELQPNLSIKLVSSYANIDFSVRTDIDATIRLGRGKWPGLYCSQITHDKMFPMCSPQLAKEIASISDLKNATLLMDVIPYDEWENWFDKANITFEYRDAKEFDDTNAQISAALLGQGICLVREELVQEHLETGELVKLFDIDFSSENHYFFVCPEDRIEDEHLKRFCEWLSEKGNADKM